MSNPELIGPAVAVLAAARAVAGRKDRLALLLDGDPGVGKTTIADAISFELTGSTHAIEHVNGQSVTADLVRDWRVSGVYGNLFSAWTVKRIDELDKASTAAGAELLTLLDYLPARQAVIATTNDFAKLRGCWKGRLESRFIRLQVDAPSVSETAAFLVAKFRLSQKKATEIARGAVPDGLLDGCNVRAAVLDAEGLVAIMDAQRAPGRKAA